MRKIIVSEFVSMDGVIQAPGGPQEDTSNGFAYGGWIAPFGDELLNEELGKVMSPPYDLLIGHFTYDIWAPYWPAQSGPIAEQFNKVTKYVVANSMTELEWQNSVLISGDVTGELEKLKAQDGPDLLVMGSSELVHTLLSANLIDKLYTFTYPVVLGKGKRLFDDSSQPYEWQLMRSVVSTSGIIMAHYEPKGDVRTGQVSE